MNPDTLAAACRYLEDHWGTHGYSIDSITPTGYMGAGVLDVRHSDGSRFALAADRYGCHFADEDHDGTTASQRSAITVAAVAAHNAHNAHNADHER